MPGTPFASDALKNITFNLGQGSFTLLIGPSGSGKTTLIQHLNGLLKPTSGTVYFDGTSIGPDKSALLSLRRRVGLVFQMPEDQFFSETVFDEIAYAPRNMGFTEDQVEASVIKALERVGLGHQNLFGRHPFHLSAGQKRLVAIAAVLSIDPEVLILDEPAAGLDPAGKKILFGLLANLNRTEKITILVSTHHLDEIAALADHLVVLNGGSLTMAGEAKEILARRAELRDLGLALPQVTEIIDELADRGLPIRADIYSLSAACDEIIRLKRADQG
jgi:energy-coupling factor transport system ATP-binding protein